jgi:hypothetical protein
MKMISLDRRTLDRRSERWPVHARIDGRLLPRAMTRDLSAGGMFIEVSDPSDSPAVGEPISLRVFVVGRGGYLDLHGRVRWVGYSHDHQCLGVGVELDIVAATADVEHPWAA